MVWNICFNWTSKDCFYNRIWSKAWDFVEWWHRNWLYLHDQLSEAITVHWSNTTRYPKVSCSYFNLQPDRHLRFGLKNCQKLLEDLNIVSNKQRCLFTKAVLDPIFHYSNFTPFQSCNVVICHINKQKDKHVGPRTKLIFLQHQNGLKKILENYSRRGL